MMYYMILLDRYWLRSTKKENNETQRQYNCTKHITIKQKKIIFKIIGLVNFAG